MLYRILYGLIIINDFFKHFSASSNYGAPSGASNSFQSADFSGSLTGFGGSSNKFDSYAPSGFGSKTPSAAYGTPAFH